MTLRTIVKAGCKRLQRIPKRYLFIGVVLVGALTYIVIFYPRTLTYEYAGQTCDQRPVLFPRLLMQSGSGDYAASAEGEWRVGGYPIFATKVCIAPTAAPQLGRHTVHLSPFAGIFARLSYTIAVQPAPLVSMEAIGAPIPVSRALQVPLSTPDSTFSYRLSADGKEAACQPKQSTLECDVPALQLSQGAAYDVALSRYFKDSLIEMVAQKSIQTLSPVSVTESSIQNGTMVYDKPTALAITTDKPLDMATVKLMSVAGGDKKELPATTVVEGAGAKVSFGEELPRAAEFELVATTLVAKDGSVPLDQYRLNFKTSGGPKVTGMNVAHTGIAPSAQVVVNFDQELKADQDISQLIAVVGAPASVSIRAAQVIIQLNGAGMCQDFTVSIKKGLISKYDIASEADWSQAMRTVCHSVSTVGYSHGGRAINAYEFGTGSRVILFVGAIHGNERSTDSLMQRWITELEARAKEIPADKKIVVVPQINPDGVARGSRVNANNIDLNRNFATGDWKKDITTVSNQPFPGGGGEMAMSEPEAKAMAALALRLRPELTLSYHSIGGLLAANLAGRSAELAGVYSQLSGYRNATGQTSTTFEYAISGTWDDWLAEKLGSASILVELGSHTYHQFERNQVAMWAMVKS